MDQYYSYFNTHYSFIMFIRSFNHSFYFINNHISNLNIITTSYIINIILII